ncbi:MAG: histidine phosphatase family protein [Desulfobacteraceae bacterium]|nr:histidine phosphatase family protein [Desulfobacteraceae bacterium]
MVSFSLIRHGKTRWNLEKRLQGEADLPLSAVGELEVASWCTALGTIPLDLILSSPMARARATAKILGQHLGLEVVTEEKLREQAFGRWQGKRLTDIRRAAPGTVEFQESLGWDFCPPGGEARHGVLDRSLAALKAAAVRFKDRNILVVTHNGVIKSLLYHALGRAFLPGEKGVIREGYLHRFSWDHGLVLEKLNAVDLNQEKK